MRRPCSLAGVEHALNRRTGASAGCKRMPGVGEKDEQTVLIIIIIYNALINELNADRAHPRLPAGLLRRQGSDGGELSAARDEGEGLAEGVLTGLLRYPCAAQSPAKP